MAEKAKEIGEVKKNGNGNGSQRVKVTVAEYRGKPYADIRTYYLDDDDEWKPTKKGVAFHSVEQVNDAIALLTAASLELQARCAK